MCGNMKSSDLRWQTIPQVTPGYLLVYHSTHSTEWADPRHSPTYLCGQHSVTTLGMLAWRLAQLGIVGFHQRQHLLEVSSNGVAGTGGLHEKTMALCTV